MNLIKRNKEINKDIESLKTEIKKVLEQIPDNPKIKRLNNSPNCFVMNFKDLDEGLNLSAEHYDNLLQVKAIKDIVDTSRNVDGLIASLQSIVDTGRHKGKYNYIFFNMGIREFIIKNLLELN